MRSDYPAVIEAMLVEPRGWSHRWGVHLHDALAKRRVPRPEQFERFNLTYCRWVNAWLTVIGRELAEWVEESEDIEAAARVVMEMNFHRMNG
ncbi:MAG: hypothetical protein ACTHW5_01600 [Microbacterium sp.]